MVVIFPHAMIDPTYMALMSNGIAWIAKTDDLINGPTVMSLP